MSQHCALEALSQWCAQFYLGTARLQLEQKGDDRHRFTAMANIVPAFGFLGIPVIGWLLDKKGYGITLGTINFLGVLASLFEAMPSLGFQVRLPLGARTQLDVVGASCGLTCSLSTVCRRR